MGRSIRVGTARGIAIQIHPSFALLFPWVIYQWAAVADAGLRGIVFGSLVLIAVFGCVLLHELAHALVAMRFGLKVRDITLLPIGGVARIEHAILSPRSETLIALAGPAVNVVISCLLTPAIALVAATRGIDDPIDILVLAGELSVAALLLYLWIANVLLAAFNLLPAFPMDGGRVLRAALTHLTDRLTATRVAVLIGQILAVTLVAVGFWIEDYLLLLVSVFILVAAEMEMRHVRIETYLRRLPVGQFALWESGGIRPDVPLAHAVTGGPGDVAVTQEGRVVGMLWRRDLLRHLNGMHHDLFVRDIMDRSINVVDVSDSVYDVHMWLTTANRPAVPVVERGQYRGIFTVDRLAHVQQHLNHNAFPWQRALLRALHHLRLVSR